MAYPHLAENPIHRAAPLITALVSCEWDIGNEDFPPTSFQISNIRSGTGARNVIPDVIEIVFNFRFSPESTVIELQNKVETICRQYAAEFTIDWLPPSPVYHTPAAELVEATRAVIRAETGLEPALATDGGTSDGRFLAPLGVEVVELGLRNATIHQIDERVDLNDLEQLTNVYEALIRRFFDPA